MARRRKAWWDALALAFLVVGFGSHAEAQAPQGQFSVMRFAPAVGPGNGIQIDSARVYGADVGGSAGVVFEYAHNPLTVYPARCERENTNCMVIEGRRYELVRYVGAAHIWGAFAVARRLQMGVIVPLVLTEGEAFQPTMGINIQGGQAFAVADPRLHIKGNLLDDASGFRLGLAGYVGFPIGHMVAPKRFIGDETVNFGGHFVAEFEQSGFRVVANLGGVWRDGRTLFSTQVGPQFTYGGLIGYDITPLIGVFGEVVGATSFSQAVDENTLEARLGGRFRFDDLVIDLGGGGGLIAGAGTPVFRIVGGFAWAPIPA
ncbi:MAG: hypothetical protein N2515_06690, partial [Deltaproteobacteria bacterium]|nr:hypothetical protein [Deltaproteobacteria bacterium]